MHEILKNVLLIITIVALVFYGNKAVQTYLGKQAVEELNFTVHSLTEAKAIANKQGKLVLADYSAIWCPSCRKLDNQVFANNLIATIITNNFVFARIDHNTNEGADFALRYDLVGFPSVMVLNANGKKLAKMPLTFDALEYKNNLQKVIAAF